MLRSAQIFKDLFLDLLFPRFCLGCGSEGKFLCSNCEARVAMLPSKQRPLCVYDYHEKLIKELIYAFKYEHLKSLDQVLTRLMLNFLQKNKIIFEEDWIISFVPMHPDKQKIRGFNQAELLAKQLGVGLNLKVQAVLIKNLNTRPQMQLNRNERLSNLRNVFSALPNASNKKIILIDDVCTTGATFEECKNTLLRAGVRRVFCFALARDI